MDYVIRPENTAISHGVCASIKKYIKRFDKNMTILDYGCGKLRNALYLFDLGYDVAILDTEEQINRINEKFTKKIIKNFKKVFINTMTEKFDLILNFFVLNVISDIEVRNRVIQSIYNNLNDGRYAIFEVRRESQIKNIKYKEKYGDGYLVGRNRIRTFQKFYYKNELEDLLIDNGFKIIDFGSTGNSYYCLVQK